MKRIQMSRAKLELTFPNQTIIRLCPECKNPVKEGVDVDGHFHTGPVHQQQNAAALCEQCNIEFVR